jgi:hypothetical protein
MGIAHVAFQYYSQMVDQAKTIGKMVIKDVAKIFHKIET